VGISESDWRSEQLRVNDVTGQMRRRIEQLELEVGRVKSDVVDIRKNFWDEVSVNLGNTDDAVETYISIKQQAEVLSERERRYSHSAASLKKLTRLVQSPYFGRIDFADTGESEGEAIYLGITSFKSESDNAFLVYDWRAPISSLYYDYPPGPVEYRAPGGNIAGTMSLKRQYVIRDGVIHLLFDTGVTIGDELLMQVLGRHSDAQMKSIVATIQREQNRIIRNDRSRMLIVQGSAGSGKTSAALQRVAYLLYKHRETLKADQMVLFSPNPLFNSYVSTVLPELGEENMQQTTFQAYLEHRLGHTFEVEDPFSQLEYILTSTQAPGYSTRLRGIDYKSSVSFLRVIQSYKDALEHDGMVFAPVMFGNRVILSPQQISDQFYSYDPYIHMTNRVELVREWILNQLSVFGEREIHEEWVEEAINLLEPEDYHRSTQQLRRLQQGKD
jgi:DNA helicase II / ATP-dependent DNA helicase PcrA